MYWVDFYQPLCKTFLLYLVHHDNISKQKNASTLSTILCVFSFLAHDTLSTSSVVKSVDTDPTRQNSLHANQTLLHAKTKQITKLSPLVQTSAPRLKTQKTIPLPKFFFIKIENLILNIRENDTSAFNFGTNIRSESAHKLSWEGRALLFSLLGYRLIER